MSSPPDNESNRARHQRQRQTIALSLLIVFGFGLIYGLESWMDAHRLPVDAAVEEERLYVTGAAAKRMSLSFNGLVADWYWMRSLQYVGRKIVQQEDNDIQLDDLSQLNLKLLAPLLDTTTTLDPQFFEAYYYAAAVLPAIDVDAAIRLLNKGIAANPTNWQLYQRLGYIYWRQGNYPLAEEAYGKGAQLPGAPPWMEILRGRMLAEGGSRDTAREIYQRLADQSDDQQVKEMAQKRIVQLQSFDERDRIRTALNLYRERNGRCAPSWKSVAALLQAERLRLDTTTAAPLDPADTPYLLIKDGCDVDLDWHSRVPYK
jgi:tetratricopeptide (TPR) repeat protein